MNKKPFYVNKIKTFKTFNSVQKLLHQNFDNVVSINNMDSNSYFEFTLNIQNLINTLGFAKNFIDSNIDTIKKYIDIENMYYTPEIYLRAVRKEKKESNEFIEFHRERYYNEFNKDCYSVWIPFVNITKNNCLKYVDETYTKVEDNIGKVENPFVKKHSPGHKIGLNYKNFKLDIDDNNVKSMIVEKNEYIIFDGNLLHGSGRNQEEYVRLAINFFIIPSKKPINYYSSKKNNNKSLYYKKYN